MYLEYKLKYEWTFRLFQGGGVLFAMKLIIDIR